VTGRYLTPDPVGLNGGINLWTYVSNNPVNRIDFFGLTDITINIDRTHENSQRTLGTAEITNSGNLNALNLFTLERTDNNNQSFTSRVNAQSYNAQRWNSPTQEAVIRLDDANGRTDILMHVGNVVNDTAGCILVGTGQTNNSVTSSQMARTSLINYVDTIITNDTANGVNTTITVNINDVPPTYGGY